MIAKEPPRASEAGHWYTRQGEPAYTTKGSSGAHRPTTLRDARRLNLVPSVTTILNVAAKPALVVWMQRQVLLAALTLPRRTEEPEDIWIARIMDDSKEQGRAAADAGTEIHAAIQAFYSGTVHKGQEEHVKGCVNTIRSHFDDRPWVSERSFSHEAGFGGKCDLHAPAGGGSKDAVVLDVKTKEFTSAQSVDGYDEHLMQLSAYRVGLGIPQARCANVFVSRNVPGLVKVVEWSADDLERGWKMFFSLLTFWQTKNQHR